MAVLRLKLLVPLLIAAILLGAAMPAPAQDKALRLSEQKIKAGLIYNFLKSTEWPSGTMPKDGGALNICLFGGDSFDGYLHPLQGRTAQTHIINIRVAQYGQAIDDCHFVFIHSNQQSQLGAVIALFKDTHILTASSIPNFARRGGMLEFGMKDQRVHLYMNKDEVADAGLIIGDNIARLTETVRR